MKKNLLSIAFLFLVNFVFAQETDGTKEKKTTKTTTTITTVISEPTDNAKKDGTSKKNENILGEDIPTNKKNNIKTSLTSFLLSTVHLNYERVINQKVTFQIGAYYTFLGSDGAFGSNNSNERGKLRGFGITPEIRFYPNGVAPMGFFVAVSPRFQYFEETGTGYNSNIGGLGYSEVKTATIGTAVIVGRQWLIGDSISLDLYLGPSVNGVISRKELNTQYTDSNLPPYTRPIGFRCGFSVGFAF